METEVLELAMPTNKDDRYENLLEHLQLKNYNLGQIIRSNSQIHLLHLKGNRVFSANLNYLYDRTNLHKPELVNGRSKWANNWSYEEDWSLTIRKDQDTTGNEVIKINDLVNLIHITTKMSVYVDSFKKSQDGNQSHVSLRLFQDDLIGFQWYVNLVYSPYNDENLRSGTIIKFVSAEGPLHSITDTNFFSRQDIFVNSKISIDEEEKSPENEDDYWVVIERKEKD